MAKDLDTTQRDALLDELSAALEVWHTAEVAAINKEAAFVKSVVKGRGGATALSTANTTRARILVIDDLESFLTGL